MNAVTSQTGRTEIVEGKCQERAKRSMLTVRHLVLPLESDKKTMYTYILILEFWT